jgi:hypothetical protein
MTTHINDNNASKKKNPRSYKPCYDVSSATCYVKQSAMCHRQPHKALTHTRIIKLLLQIFLNPIRRILITSRSYEPALIFANVTYARLELD